MIICITGLPGTGKSMMAKLMKERLEKKGTQVFYYTTDWIRYRIYPELTGDRNKKDQPFLDFIPEQLERSYNGLYMLIEELVKANPRMAIITDGQFRKESQRARLVEIAKKYKTECLIVKAESEEDTILSRLEKRLERSEGAGPSNYLAVKDQYEEPLGDSVYRIQNGGNLEDLKKEVDNLLNKIWKNL